MRNKIIGLSAVLIALTGCAYSPYDGYYYHGFGWTGYEPFPLDYHRPPPSGGHLGGGHPGGQHPDGFHPGGGHPGGGGGMHLGGGMGGGHPGGGIHPGGGGGHPAGGGHRQPR